MSRIRFSDTDRNMGGIQIFSYNFTSLANNRSENKWQKNLTEMTTKLTFDTVSLNLVQLGEGLMLLVNLLH